MIVETLQNPAMASMIGPYFGEEGVYDLGAIFSAEMSLMTMAVVATMAILAVTRHTRKDEEVGRFEMIRSFPVGKSTVLMATIIVYTLVSLLVGLVCGLSLILSGLEGVNFNGAMIFGLCLSMAGIFFVSITSVFAQLSQSSRGAVGYSFALLGASYILRGLGDISGNWLSYLPPFGMLLNSQSLVENIWWPILIVMVITAIFGITALKLNHIRDLDASFIPARKGKKNASVFLRGIFTLAFKNQRTALVSWVIAMFVLGASYGSVLGSIEEFFSGNELYQQLVSSIGGTGSLVDRFIVMLYAVVAIVAVIPTLQVVNKLRYEESHGRIEPVLARPVSRNRLIISYLILAMSVSMVMTLSGVLGLYIAGAQVTTVPLVLSNMILAVMAYLPAAWIFIGVSILILGVAPGLIKMVWVYLGFGFASIYFGGILKLPDWVVKLSPFGHVQRLPVEEYNITSGIGMVVLFGVLVAIGSLMYRSRDLN